MSKKSNPTLIGAFVVGATALLAIGVAVFGGAELFAKKDVYVSYFTQKAQGLRKGSNVTMNGVHIGHVSDLVLLVHQDTYQTTTKVTMDILPDSWIVTSGGVRLGTGLETGIPHDQLVNVGGLRAELKSESLVTGQLLVDITFQPDTEAVMRGGGNSPYPEIPTIPSNIQAMLANIQRLFSDLTKDFDAREFSRRFQSIIRGADELANSRELRESLAGANTLINREETQQLSASLQETLAEVGSAATAADSLMRNADASLDTDLKPLITKMAATLDEARGALDEAQGALAAAKFQLRGESVQVYQLGETLREVEGAARAMREFLDYLERNPEAFLKGKKP
jgi:paraquat-inducible protein B